MFPIVGCGSGGNIGGKLLKQFITIFRSEKLDVLQFHGCKNQIARFCKAAIWLQISAIDPIYFRHF